MSLTERTLRGIANYRASSLHDRVGRCRYSRTCSHYAEAQLRQHSYPVAVLLIGFRLLRCGRVFAVLALAAITTLLVAATASAAAAAPMQSGSPTTQGGCNAYVGGVPIGTLDKAHPLQVHIGQGIVVTGTAPPGVVNVGNIELHSRTDIRIHFIEKMLTRRWVEDATGTRFQRAVNVDTYLHYGSGLYAVDVLSVASPGWDCSARFYVELHGSKLAAEVAVAVGGVGALGVAASKGDAEPPPFESPPKVDEHGMYDPAIAPDVLEKAQARQKAIRDKAATRKADTVGCLAAILFALIASTGAFATAVPVPAAQADPRRVWVRGHPVLGFLSGLVAGLGTTVALWQLNRYPLTFTTAIVVPLFMACLGGWRGWRGRAWTV